MKGASETICYLGRIDSLNGAIMTAVLLSFRTYNIRIEVDGGIAMWIFLSTGLGVLIRLQKLNGIVASI